VSKLIITRGLRGFKIEVGNGMLRRRLEIYCESLIQPKMERRQGRFIPVPGDRYFIECPKQTALYLANAHYEAVLEIINTDASGVGAVDYTLVINDAPVHDGTDVDFSKHTLSLEEPAGSKFEYQNKIVAHASREGYNHNILEIQTGKGKALRNNTPVRIPLGWKNIGDIEVGDLVIGVNGLPTKVTAVHPQGVVDLFRVTFEDNRFVECCAEHLWEVVKSKGQPPEVVNTAKLINRTMVNRERLSVPLCYPEDTPDVELAIDPYTVGSYLVNPDDVVQSMAVINRGVIPDEYIASSIKQRTEVLQGIFDSVGKFRAIDSKIIVFVKHKLLARSIMTIVRSLGGIAHLIVKGAMWQLTVRVSNPGRFFTDPVKIKMCESVRTYALAKSLAIKSIIPVKRSEATCITVDAPSALFVVKDYIVTHNTAMAMKTVVNIGKRTLFITKPGYLDKWTSDLTNPKYSLSLKAGELIRVGGKSGSSSNLDLMDGIVEMGKDGELSKGKGRKECKVILLSSKTFDLWIKRQLEDGDPKAVETFMEVTGCGYLVYDESHEWFRMNYWSFYLLNPSRVLDLSATIIPGDDKFIKDRYEERFPAKFRYADLAYDKYIDALSIYYHMRNKKSIDRVNRMKLYNHIELEQIIMKDPKSQLDYFTMVKDLVDIFFMKRYEPGQRCLVFFGSREMCTRFTEFIKLAYPEKDVKRHIQGDNYKAFINADIGVSTPGKSGTAVDIVGLVCSIITVCLAKEDKNIQILGRTRSTDEWDLDPKAIFLHCQQLNKHVAYLQRRKMMFRGKVKSFKVLNSKFIIK